MTINNLRFYTGNLLIFVTIFIGLTLIFSYGMGNVAAANPGDIIYVNSSGGQDSYNGSSWLYAKQSISNATGTVNVNGTVNIANGLYTGSNNIGITLTKNMTIIGESQANTIINGEQSGQSIFTIASGVSVTIINLTLTNNTAANGGAVYNNGNLTETKDTFSNNMATSSSRGSDGGAIYNNGIITDTSNRFINNTSTLSSYCTGSGAIYNNGIITDTNDTFIYNTVISSSYGNDGGAIYNDNTLTIINNTFNYNTATSSSYGYDGGAIFNDNSLTIINNTFNYNTATSSMYGRDGGAIFNDGTITSANDTFNNNTATLKSYGSDGGAIYNIGTITCANDKFDNNTAIFPMFGIGGGAIYNDGITNITFSCIIGNNILQGAQIYNAAQGNMNATENWWGTNNPNISGNNIINNGGICNYDIWIVLSINASSPADPNNSSTVTADLTHDSNGNDTLGYLTIPDGITVNFSSVGLVILNPMTNITNGVATTIVTATILGNYSINATANNQTVSTTIDFYYPTPVANFIVNVPTGTAPSTVQFTDNSTNIVNGYNWNFGDGSSNNTEQNPSHTYLLGGIYTVTETITGPGGSNSTTSIVNITPDTTIPVANANLASGLFNSNQTVILSATDNDPNLEIYYTLNGTNPTTNSTLYTGPLTISNEGTTTLEFIAVDTAGNISNTVTRTYTIDTIPPTANDNLTSGQYNTSQNISLSRSEVGTIYYTIDGSTPTNKSNIYTDPIPITTNTTLKYLAIDLAGNQSPIYTENYNIVPTANINPAGGIYNSNQIVTLNMSEPGAIYFTFDDSNPTTSSYKYKNPITLTSNTTLKYISIDLAGNQSQIYTQTYTIDTIPPTASSNPPEGFYNSPKIITLNMNEPGTIYFTLDGSNPSTSCSEYYTPITITTTTDLKYLAVDLANNTSPIYSDIYTIDTIPPTANVNPTGGLYNTNKIITLTMNEAGTIYYTTDGNTPTNNSNIYTDPIPITTNTTLKYLAIDASRKHKLQYIHKPTQ